MLWLDPTTNKLKAIINGKWKAINEPEIPNDGQTYIATLKRTNNGVEEKGITIAQLHDALDFCLALTINSHRWICRIII